MTAPNGNAQKWLLAAAMVDGGSASDALVLSEMHGTGTKLGDPIETASLVGAVQKSRAVVPLVASSVKANFGHTEPTAGVAGLLKLALGLRASEAAPNAQLAIVNEHVMASLKGTPCAMPTQLAALPAAAEGEPIVGAVSSFGYSGTIVNAVLRTAAGAPPNIPPRSIKYTRKAYTWSIALFSSLAGQEAAQSAEEAPAAAAKPFTYSMAWAEVTAITTSVCGRASSLTSKASVVAVSVAVAVVFDSVKPALSSSLPPTL